MPVFNNILAGAAGQGGSGTYEIQKSIRLFSNDGSHFDRTPSTEGNRSKWTWSGWIKLTGDGDSYNPIWSAGNNPWTGLHFLDNTPVQNADGSNNFSGYTVVTRNGTQAQNHIPGDFGSQQVERSVNIEVDPRGKSSIRGAGARIPTGDVAEVRGTKRMLAEKKKTAKWY